MINYVINVNDFVKETKLDRITGTRNIVRVDGYNFEQMSKRELERLKLVDTITGQTLYKIEHGFSPVIDYLTKLLKNKKYSSIITSGKDTVHCFNIDDKFTIYVLNFINNNDEEDDYTYWWSLGVYINAKKVDLPYLKTTELDKTQRIYIVLGDTKDEFFKAFKFPLLNYPKPFKGFFDWLRKNKKITFKKRLVYDKNDKEVYSSVSYYRRVNIKTEQDLKDYINHLKGSKKSRYDIPLQKLENITPITITQDDINNYISEANNRYKVYR